jgi:N-acetylmuramoyl-L-alanine amidase
MRIEERPSPSFGERREPAVPHLIVLHYTGMRTAEDAIRRLCDPSSEVSAHYLIAEDGGISRLVDERRRAWHAGAGRWFGTADLNSASIGIELANPGPLDAFPPFPDAQMNALEALLDDIMARWKIPPSGVIGHSDLAPGRKSDPGPKFDWRRLALGNRASWSPGRAPAGPVDGARFAEAARAAGYSELAGTPDEILASVRLRHRPWALGRALEATDIAVLREMARRNPER